MKRNTRSERPDCASPGVLRFTGARKQTKHLRYRPGCLPCWSVPSVGSVGSLRWSARRPTPSACSAGLPHGSIQLASSRSLLNMAPLARHRRHPPSPMFFIHRRVLGQFFIHRRVFRHLAHSRSLFVLLRLVSAATVNPQLSGFSTQPSPGTEHRLLAGHPTRRLAGCPFFPARWLPLLAPRL